MLSACAALVPPSLLLLASCAARPSVSEMHAARECYVWASVGKSTVAVEVKGDRAELARSSLEATWLDETHVVVPVPLGEIQGTYERPLLRVHIFEATISPPNATLRPGSPDLSITSNAACDERQLALGTALILVAMLVVER